MTSEKSSLKIVFFGSPEFIVPVAKKLSEKFDLVGVVTSPDAPVGRKKIMTPSPIKLWYMNYILENNKEGIILTPEKLSEETAIKLRKLHPDIFVVAAYGKLIPKSILAIPPLGSINIHPSSLPKYRGPSPIQTALLNGESSLGISLMLMDEELDHGPLLQQWEIPITKTDTFESLHTKSFIDAGNKLPELIEEFIKGSIVPKVQDDTKATFSQKITKQDGYFSFDNPPETKQLYNMIHAFYPWPTAWTKIELHGKEVRMKLLPDNLIQLEGGKPMKRKEFLNGYPDFREKIEKLLG